MVSKPQKVIVILAVFVVLIAGLALAELGNISKGSSIQTLPLNSGSELDYSISGSVNNTTSNAPIQGYLNVSFDQFSKSGDSFMSVESCYAGGMGDIAHPSPVYNNEKPAGMLISYDRITTPLGEKSVETWFEPFNDHVMITQIGMESSILYQVIVSSPDYHYSISLIYANNTNLEVYDNPLDLPQVSSLAHPSIEPTSYQCDNGSTCCNFGLVNIRAGENLKYTLTGNSTSALFFTTEDLRMIEETGMFTYNSSISRAAGDPGSFDFQVLPGTYFYVITVGSLGSASQYWQ